MQYQSPYEGSVAYACSGIFATGGVAPKTTRLRGQSIIECVLIIAVIGLVIVFAGPGVAGAIRNQFNQVTNAVDSGTDGDNFMSAEEKAYREAMKTVAQKEAKDWTLDEQKAAATDIAKNGTSSVVYAKAKAAMDAGTTWSVKLTNGETMKYRIIGINHDDLADGSGKAGLTFMESNNLPSLYKHQMNSQNKTDGGWEASELRQKMNSGEIWNLIPSDFQPKVRAVRKLTNNVGGGDANKDAAVTATTDKLFLISSTEFWGDIDSDGSQYEYFKGTGISSSSTDGATSGQFIWTRSPYTDTRFATNFRCIRGNSSPSYLIAKSDGGWVRPAFCF